MDVTMVPIKKNLGYLISYKEYLKDMHAKLEHLNAVRMDVEAHMNANRLRRLEVPAQVMYWLEEAEKINADVENISNDVSNSFNLKMRHMVGKRALKIIMEIESLVRQQSMIPWTDAPIPLGKVDFTKASTSTPSSDDNEFQSRAQTFKEALKALEPDNKSHMIALWGMGGVGKTTMMKKLKKVVEERKMFHFIVEAVIGEKTDPIAVQENVADYLGIQLKEYTKDVRAYELREGFKAISQGGKKKVLVILDDVWEPVDLYDIGLCTSPDQDVDFKVLLTSRNRDVCIMMGVEESSIMKVGLLNEEEAQSFFRKFVEISDDVDPELLKIGEDIVRKCSGLPLAIKVLAINLKHQSKDAWKDTLAGFEHNDTHNFVTEYLKLSYDNIQDQETQSIFLLCGLFPKDFDIPTEDLVRYGWGLKLFQRVNTIRDARNRLDKCIERLMDANLLIESDNVGCVKMHHLVLAFLLDMFSKVEHATIVNHGSMLGWSANDMNGSCKRISLTCEGVYEFPSDLMFPNLSVLKLIGRDELLRFPENFYGEMEKLEVISYDKMKNPLLPTSLQCSTVRVLHLHHCSLMFDCSSIGDLLNLEVLSVANSSIEHLSSEIGNLKKLRLLDVTNCVGLHIDNGVLRNLIKLEELYMRVDDRHSFFVRVADRKAINFTDDNYNEMAERLENLYVLEFEFFQNTERLKNISFENLEQFKISVGRSLKGAFRNSKRSLENTLKLVTSKGELLKSRMNELFEKTEVLCLSVDDMNDLGDIEVKSIHPPRFSSFYNVRVLVISECAELTYLFTLGVAKAFRNLEHLEVYSCENMEVVIHTDIGGEETITFPKLRFLSLIWLPNLSGLCNKVNIIELPQLVELGLGAIPNFRSIYANKKSTTSCFLKEEVVIPRLEKLRIRHMENLMEIWPCEFSMNQRDNVSLLREIEVTDCDKVVNLFPRNPMSLLQNLEELHIFRCGSVEVLFIVDLGYLGDIGVEGSSRLKRIKVNHLGKLREVWRIKGAENSRFLIRGFQAVEYIEITKCKEFRNVFTPTTINFHLGALVEISINNKEETGRNNKLLEARQEQEINVISNGETSKAGDYIYKVVFPSYLIHSFHNLHHLKLWSFEGVDAVFEIEPRSRELVTTHDNQQRLFPYLKELDIRHMDNISHVWKGKWNKNLILQKQESESSFHNLTNVHVSSCRKIKYLFSPLMAKLLPNLKNVKLAICDNIEEVVSNRDEAEEKTRYIHTSTNLFPRLSVLTLACLRNLGCIGPSSSDNTTTTVFLDQSKVDGVSWSLCQFPRELTIVDCDALSSVIPFYAAGQMQKLQVLKIESCKLLEGVFETHNTVFHSTHIGERNGGTPLPTLNNVIMLQLPNLTILEIKDCDLVEHIFTFSTLESLKQLQELVIVNCKEMEMIVKEEHGEETTSKVVVVFPRLRSIALVNLPCLKGFFLGMNEFHWPSLNNVTIRDCPEITVFTRGPSIAPQLKYMKTDIGEHVNGSGLNFHQTPLPSSYKNKTKIHLGNDGSRKKIIPSDALQQLQKLEEIHVWSCDLVDEVFEALEGTNSSSDGSQTVVELPNLTKVELLFLQNLMYIWKSNRWTMFEFPNLTRVSISHCHTLEHVFTTSMIGSLLKLQELHISSCNNLEVVIKEEHVVGEGEEEKSHEKMNEIVLPRLESLILDELPCLKGFCIGKKDFSLPLLNTFRIERCGAITIFTKGNSATPELKEIVEDINTFIKLK